MMNTKEKYQNHSSSYRNYSYLDVHSNNESERYNTKSNKCNNGDNRYNHNHNHSQSVTCRTHVTMSLQIVILIMTVQILCLNKAIPVSSFAIGPTRRDLGMSLNQQCSSKLLFTFGHTHHDHPIEACSPTSRSRSSSRNQGQNMNINMNINMNMNMILKSTTSLYQSARINDNDDNNINDDQISRRRKRRSRQQQNDGTPIDLSSFTRSPPSKSKSTSAPTASRKRMNRQRREVEYTQQGESVRDDDSSQSSSNRSVRKTIRNRKYRQMRNNVNINGDDNDNDNDNDNIPGDKRQYWDEVILPNTLDLSVQAMNNVKDVAKKTARKSKHLMDDIGTGLNNFIDDDDDNYDDDDDQYNDQYNDKNVNKDNYNDNGDNSNEDNYNIDENGIQEVDWYYVSKDDNNNDVGWVRTNRKKAKSSSPSRQSTPRSSSRPPSRSPSRPQSSSQSQAGRYRNQYDDYQEKKPRRKRPMKKRVYKRDVAQKVVPVKRTEVPLSSSFDDNYNNERQEHPSSSTTERINVNKKKTNYNIEEDPEILMLPPKLQEDVYFPSLDNKQDVNNNLNEEKIDDRRTTTDGKRFDRTTDRIRSDNAYESQEKNSQSYRKKRKQVNIPNNINKNVSPSTRSRTDGSRRKRNPNNEEKKIYSVYPQQQRDDDYMTQEEKDEKKELQDLYGKVAADAIDSVGNLMADVIEGKYWNSTDKASSPDRNKNEQSKTSASFKSKSDYRNSRQRPLKQRRHWKDRLTEKVDYALGVHEDGNFYRKWEDKLDREKMSEVANDPVSIFYGRQKKEHGPKRSVNFWEEDGNLMSLFFGRTPDGQKLSLDRASSANICTTLFKVSFQYSIAILSQVCRWASCRGSLPQPIVVFFLAASALSAPRRRKLLTVGITLIALRTLAEALHGFVHDEWEDTQDKFTESAENDD